jgi:Flp pilus assembly protein TadD
MALAAMRMAAVGAGLMLGGCAQMGSLDTSLADAGKGPRPDHVAAGAGPGELTKAIEHWRKEHEKAPRELKPALAYARNLKAAGQKDRALEVLQRASIYHAEDRELLSEYGRLALDLDHVTLAQKLLEKADDPSRPDWRVVSARGTALAKQGHYGEAIPLYERALTISPSQPSVLNNLAMALTADGQAERAETLLKRAAEAPDSDPKVRRNLTLVLGLQGKHEDARRVAALDATPTVATADVDALRKMVRAEPRPAATAPVIRVTGPAAPAAGAPAPLLQQASVKAPAVAAKPMADEAAEAIIQKALLAEVARAGAANAKPNVPQLALRKGGDDVVASQGPPAPDGPAAALALKPTAR